MAGYATSGRGWAQPGRGGSAPARRTGRRPEHRARRLPLPSNSQHRRILPWGASRVAVQAGVILDPHHPRLAPPMPPPVRAGYHEIPGAASPPLCSGSGSEVGVLRQTSLPLGRRSGRQEYPHLRVLSRLGPHLDVSPVFPGDVVGQAEPQAGVLARVPRREERLEHLLFNLRRDARTVVSDRDGCAVPGPRRSDQQFGRNPVRGECKTPLEYRLATVLHFVHLGPPTHTDRYHHPSGLM